MPSFKFEYNGKVSNGKVFDQDSKKKVAVELEDDDFTVYELLEEFMNFLQGVGYRFDISERLDVVKDEEETLSPALDDEEDEILVPVVAPAPSPVLVEEVAPAPVTEAAPEPEVVKPVEPKTISEEELAAEIERIRPTMLGVSEEALKLIAQNNLSSKVEQFMPAKTGTKRHGKGRAKLGSKKRAARRKKK